MQNHLAAKRHQTKACSATMSHLNGGGCGNGNGGGEGTGGGGDSRGGSEGRDGDAGTGGGRRDIGPAS
jgi:hypothetical protein